MYPSNSLQLLQHSLVRTFRLIPAALPLPTFLGSCSFLWPSAVVAHVRESRTLPRFLLDRS